jgi:hypothetical protein
MNKINDRFCNVNTNAPVGVTEGGEIAFMASQLDRDFEEFHALHPYVYDQLVDLAQKAKARGRQRVGMKQLFEVLRWERMLQRLPAEGEEFKLNNNYTSRYARLIMDQETDLAGLFEIRMLRT